MQPPRTIETIFNFGRTTFVLCTLLVSLCVFPFAVAMAQSPAVKFTHLTNLNGLSQSTVQAIVKDKYGFMWFGTQDGLNRYDGYNFKVYRHRPNDSTSLRRSHIVCLYEDRAGQLWIGTSNGALSRYDRENDKFIHYKESDGNFQGLSQKSVTAICEDRQDNLWIGTYWKLNLLDRKTGKITQFGHDPADDQSISSDGITCIFQDSRNNLWVGTSNGLNIVDLQTKKFKRYLHDDVRPGSISSNMIRVIDEDHKGRVWIGTDEGINIFDPATETFSYYKKDENNPASLDDNGIREIEKGDNGKMWIGTSMSLDQFDPATETFTHFKNNPNDPSSLDRNGTVMSMLYDRDGILWIGTYQGGINKYDKSLAYFNTYKNNPNDQTSVSFNVITSFAENVDGDVWIATGGGALNLWKRKSNEFIRLNPDPQNENSLSTWGLLSLCQSQRNGYLWIGTYGKGMDRYDPATNTFKHYNKGTGENDLNNEAVYAILEDKHGKIWIGTNGGGVNVLDPTTGKVIKYMTNSDNHGSVAGNFVRCFYEDKSGRIWIGTSTGASAFDPATGVFTRYDQGNTKLESDVIYAIHEDKKGNIWIGTLGGGLNQLDPATKNIRMFTTRDGLPDNTINDIIEDDHGYLWLSTNNGISRFDPSRLTFKNSSPLNGVQSPEFSQGAGLKTSAGTILFGGINGFNSFHPADLIENRNIPPVVMTGFKLFNEPVTVHDRNSPLKVDISIAKEITLSHNQSIITLEFAALGYTASEKNQYAFRLEGFDKKWNYVNFQHSATYTNLDPGVYFFKVKASNNDGLWNEKETVLKLTITPPFWLTWWFKAGLILLVLGLALLVYRIRVSTIKQQREKLHQKVKEQTIELEQKNKEMEHFVYIASHDLREPLRTTTAFAELLQSRSQGELDEKGNAYLGFVIEGAARMKRLIDDLLDYSRIGQKKDPETIDCNTILQDVLSDLDKVISETGARVNSGSLPLLNGHPTAIKQLFQNLIANGIKFRKPETASRIEITSEVNSGICKFSFTDNGIGIDPKYRERIFAIFERLHTRKEYEGTGIGLAHCKKIVELHKGRIWVESVPGEGSTFYFTIPQNLN